MPLQLNVSCTDYSDYACGPAIARRRSLIWILQYFAAMAISLFWSLRGDNRPHRIVSSEVPIKQTSMLGLCRAHVGGMLGTCWAHVGSMLGRVGPRAYVAPMLGLYWP